MYKTLYNSWNDIENEEQARQCENKDYNNTVNLEAWE